MFYQVEYQVGRDTDKSVNRVVYNFLFIQCIFLGTKMCNKGTTRVVYLLKFC